MADRLAALTNSYHSYSLEEALAGIAEAGFRSVELSAVRNWTEHVSLDADANEIARIKNLLEQHGLEVVSLAGHSDIATDEGVAQFRKAMDLATAFGVSIVNTGTGGELHPGEEDVEALRAAFLERIDQVADDAAARGLMVCLEIHGHILPSGAVGAELIQTIGRDNVRLNYDPGNAIFYGGVDPVEDIRVALPYMGHFHVKDQIGGKGVWNFPAVGDGEIDFTKIFELVNASDYRGPCSVEIEFQGEPWPPLAEVNAAMRRSYEFLRPLVPA